MGESSRAPRGAPGVTDLSPDDAKTIRSEIELLRRRVDELEVRLDTRIAAEEQKRHDEIEDLRSHWKDLTVALEANTRTMGNVSSQVRASHFSLVHLLAVTARQVKVPDKD